MCVRWFMRDVIFIVTIFINNNFCFLHIKRSMFFLLSENKHNNRFWFLRDNLEMKFTSDVSFIVTIFIK